MKDVLPGSIKVIDRYKRYKRYVCNDKIRFSYLDMDMTLSSFDFCDKNTCAMSCRSDSFSQRSSLPWSWASSLLRLNTLLRSGWEREKGRVGRVRRWIGKVRKYVKRVG